MRRRAVALILGLFAAVAAVAQLTWYLESMPPLSGAWGAVAWGLAGTVLTAAIPAAGAVLLARHHEAGIAVLVGAGLVAIPMIILLPRFLVSDGGSELGAWLTWLNVGGQFAVVIAGALAWTLRRPALWRRDRPVTSPYVAVAAAALLLKELPGIIRSDGPLGIFRFNDFALMTLTTIAVIALILVAAARLPRRLAACLLLASFTPRLYSSISLVASPMGPASTLDVRLAWLAMVAEAALVGLAIWWLVAERDHALEAEGRIPDPASSSGPPPEPHGSGSDPTSR